MKMDKRGIVKIAVGLVFIVLGAVLISFLFQRVPIKCNYDGTTCLVNNPPYCKCKL